MTDDQPMTDDFERALVRALRAEAYSVPLQLGASDLSARARPRQSPLSVALRALLAAGLVIGAIVLAVLVLPRVPALVGPAADAECDVSAVTRHGGWWTEIGGDRAYFQAEPTGMYAGPGHSWLIHVRFSPDAGSGQTVSMWADHLETGERAHALLGERTDPGNIFRFDQPAPSLPGGWYLFQQGFPTPGCWRLTAAIDGEVVGTAVVSVDDSPAPTASPRNAAPTPRQPAPLPSGTAPATPGAATAAPVQWHEPAAYSFTLESQCGERFLIGRFDVEVRNGETVRVEALDGYNGPHPVPLGAVPTLKAILDRAADARRQGASEVSVVLDPVDGHPISVSIDGQANVDDDEECYLISDYLPGGVQ